MWVQRTGLVVEWRTCYIDDSQPVCCSNMHTLCKLLITYCACSAQLSLLSPAGREMSGYWDSETK